MWHLYILKYMKKPTVTGELVEVYQPSHEGNQKFNDINTIWKLGWRSFGYVAQGLGNLKPWLLYKLVSNKTHLPHVNGISHQSLVIIILPSIAAMECPSKILLLLFPIWGGARILVLVWSWLTVLASCRCIILVFDPEKNYCMV